MKILESQPRRYDRGISWLSFGGANAIKHEIVERYIESGDRVLDIGAGTGTLTLMAAEKASSAVGMDVSAAMLKVAEEKRRKSPEGEKVKFIEAGVAEMDRALAGETFDAVTASLVFSELSDDEQRYTLRQAHDALKPGGKLIITDETRPPGLLRRILYTLARLPVAMLTFILTQTSTRPVVGMEEKVSESGFETKSIEYRNLLHSTMLIFAVREDEK